ncbi:ATP-dependent protease La domain-containing protein [Xylariales sp. PMI_506]|nr:ATP-dependent protease La domain-containing protein [Xylariales sp. PMI_506]
MSSLQVNPSSTISQTSTSSPNGSSSHGQPEADGSPSRSTAGSIASGSGLLLSAAKHARQIIRLVQCGICSRILREPITLPCGQSLCKQCIPRTHLRMNISWPATADRLQGFFCPFEDCSTEHAVGDCNIDIVLSRVLSIVRAAMEQGHEGPSSPNLQTHIAVQDRWALTGVPALAGKENASQVLKGGRIFSTYTLAEMGTLEYSSEVTYTAVGASEEEVTRVDEAVFTNIKELVRAEMDCQVCYALYLEPLTTTCGHTFCRNCLHRVFRNSELCPICRRGLFLQSQRNYHLIPANQRLTNMIDGFWADIVAIRTEHVLAEQQAELAGEFDIPIFVCTLSFPGMATFLHVFEPRYRLMIRRAMESDQTFGMVLEKRPTEPGGANFCEIGTLLRIVNIEFFPDGRSLLETVGVSRFRVVRHNYVDGYVVANVEKVNDVSLAEEEAMEVTETMRTRGVQDFVQNIGFGNPSSPEHESNQTADDVLTTEHIEAMTTGELLTFGASFVTKMRAQSVTWLAARVLAVYGECPQDPSIFPWWLASVLPVNESERYRLLETSSVRQRMKICCQWILEWESSRW